MDKEEGEEEEERRKHLMEGYLMCVCVALISCFFHSLLALGVNILMRGAAESE